MGIAWVGQNTRIPYHHGNIGKPAPMCGNAPRPWVFDNGHHGEHQHAQHHGKACRIGHIMGAEPQPFRNRAHPIRQDPPHDGPHGQAHGIGPLRAGQGGLDIHPRRCGPEGFDKPRLQRARPQRTPETDAGKGNRQNREIAGRQKQRDRHQAGHHRHQEHRLAANTVGQPAKRQFHRHGRDRIDPEQQRDLEQVHPPVGQGQHHDRNRQPHRETIKELMYLKHADVPSCRTAQRCKGKPGFCRHARSIAFAAAADNSLSGC
jgi:hypothetical protein